MAKKVATKKSKIKLTEDQIKYGSMYLAASNLASEMTNVANVNDIRRQWAQVPCESDEQERDIENERIWWAQKLKDGEAFHIESLQKEVPFLFETA